MSGTVRHRTLGRGQIPFEGSGIPRKVEHASTVSQSVSSDVGGTSTVSTSRQKQTKRDEVLFSLLLTPFGGVQFCLDFGVLINKQWIGYQEEDRGGS